MSKPKPSKRKSIHDKDSLDDNMKDNVENNAIVTRSKALEKQKETNAEKSDENGLSELSSDEEETLNDIQVRRSSSAKYETYIRLRNQQRRSASSYSRRVDSSPSPTRDPSQNIEFGSKKNNLKQQIKKTSQSSHETNTSPSKSSGSISVWPIIVVIIVALVLIGLAVLYFHVSEFDSDEDSNVNVLKCEKEDVRCITDDVKRTLKSMKAKYTNQDDDLWRDAFFGIKSIIHNPKKPSIIVLLGEKTGPLNCLAVLLGNVSSNALNSDLLKLTPEKFENDMGSVITSLRSSIKDNKAVIVWDLLSINEEALKAFHNLCDRINPLVEEVIYIITIIADDYDKRIKPLEYVEKKLYKKLSGKIKEDAIQPLITRITDGPILAVQPEPDVIDCPLSSF